MFDEGNGCDLFARVCASFGQENEATDRETCATKICCRICQNLQGRLCNQFKILINKPCISNIVSRKKIVINTSGALSLSGVFLGKIIALQNGQFCKFVKFTLNVFNSCGHRIVFPKNILSYLETSTRL